MASRVLLAAWAVLVVSLPGAARARDMNGKFGIGFDQSLGGVSGIAFRYWIGDIGIRTVVGADFVVPKHGDTRTGVNAAVGAVYNFARSDQANLGIGATVDFGYKNAAASGGGSLFQFNVELPLAAEVFVSDHFSINVAFGIVIAIVPSGGRALADAIPVSSTGEDASAPKETGIHIGTGNLTGNIGFTYYF